MKRRGFVETRLYPLVGWYPWECTGCRMVFRSSYRGPTKRKRRREGEVHLPPVG